MLDYLKRYWKVLLGLSVAFLLFWYRGPIASFVVESTVGVFGGVSDEARDVYNMPIHNEITDWKDQLFSPKPLEPSYLAEKWKDGRSWFWKPPMFIINNLTYAFRAFFSYNSNWLTKAGWVGNGMKMIYYSVPVATGLATKKILEESVKSGVGMQPTKPWYGHVGDIAVQTGKVAYTFMLPLWPLFGRPSYYQRQFGLAYLDDKLNSTFGEGWQTGAFGKCLPDYALFQKPGPPVQSQGQGQTPATSPLKTLFDQLFSDSEDKKDGGPEPAPVQVPPSSGGQLPRPTQPQPGAEDQEGLPTPPTAPTQGQESPSDPPKPPASQGEKLPTSTELQADVPRPANSNETQKEPTPSPNGDDQSLNDQPKPKDKKWVLWVLLSVGGILLVSGVVTLYCCLRTRDKTGELAHSPEQV